MIKQLTEAAKEYGLPGLIILAIAYVLAKSAKPLFKFLAVDRENKRKHFRLLDKRRNAAEKKIREKKEQKGKKP